MCLCVQKTEPLCSERGGSVNIRVATKLLTQPVVVTRVQRAWRQVREVADPSPICPLRSPARFARDGLDEFPGLRKDLFRISFEIVRNVTFLLQPVQDQARTSRDEPAPCSYQRFGVSNAIAATKRVWSGR